MCMRRMLGDALSTTRRPRDPTEAAAAMYSDHDAIREHQDSFSYS